MRSDMNGEGEASRGLSSLLVSMTVMFDRVREEQTKPAMLWGWRTNLSLAPPGLPKSSWERGGFLKGRGPHCFEPFGDLKGLFYCSALRPSLWLDSHGSTLDSPSSTSYVGTISLWHD